jgi:CBS domain-containing protein
MDTWDPFVSDTRDLELMRVADAMHRGVVTCARQTSLVAVAYLMAAQRIHCVAVVATMPEGEMKLCGVVSDRDVLASAISGDMAEDTAEGCAATEVLTVTPDDPLLRAAELMHEYGLTHVVVVEPGTETPIGVLSTLDIAAVAGRVWPTPKAPVAA